MRPPRSHETQAHMAGVRAPGGVRAAGGMDRALRRQCTGRRLLDLRLRRRQPDRLHGCGRFCAALVYAAAPHGRGRRHFGGHSERQPLDQSRRTPAARLEAARAGGALRDHRLRVQSRGPPRGVHRGLRPLPRSRMAHQRRLDGQHGAAAASGGMALYRRWRQPAKARRHSPPARASAASHRDRHGDRSGHAHSRTRRGQHDRSESLRQRLPAIRRRRGLSRAS